MERLRVFIIDEHTHARRVLAEHLARHHDRLEILGERAPSRTVVDEVARLRPNVVLLDVKMTEADGIRICRALKALEPSPAVIVLTSFYDEAEYQAVLQSGVDAYLLKSPNTSELLSQLLAIRPWSGRERAPNA